MRLFVMRRSRRDGNLSDPFFFSRDFLVFLLLPVHAWQASWAWVVSLPITLANFSAARAVPMGPAGWACLGLAAAGLAIETVADYQVGTILCAPCTLVWFGG